MRTKLTKVNYVIHDRGDTKYSQSENSQNQAAQEGAWVQVSAMRVWSQISQQPMQTHKQAAQEEED